MSLMDLLNKKSILPLESEALKGREEEIEVPPEHFVNGTSLKAPFPEGLEQAIFGMGCFWGVERRSQNLQLNMQLEKKFKLLMDRLHHLMDL